MNKQKGSVYLWIILITFVIGVALAWFYARSQSQMDAELAKDRVIPSESPPTSSSPNYSVARKQYNLNDKQVEILSNVINDGKL